MKPCAIPCFPPLGSRGRRAWFQPGIEDTDGNRVAIGEPCMFRTAAIAQAAQTIAAVEAEFA